jgi:O-antigen/teichoic acid export membrane protein
MADHATESIGTLARGITINMLGGGFNVVSRLLFNVLVARLLGPRQVGVYYLALTVAYLTGVIAVGGLDTTVIRYLARFRVEDNWGAFRGTLRFALRAVGAFGIIGSVVVLAGAPWFANVVFRKPEVTTPLRVVALYVPLFAFEMVLLAATQSFKRMQYKVYIEAMLNPTLRIILAFSVYLMGGRVCAILAVYILSLFICAVLAVFALRKCIPVKLSDYAPSIDRQDLMKYWHPLFWGNVLNFLVLYADSLVLAHYRSTAEVGLYSVCIRLVIVQGFFLGVITQIFGPMISELHHRGEIAQLAEYSKVVTLWAVEVFAPFALFFAVARHEILGLFGEGFRVASPALLILIVGQFVNYVTGPTGVIINMGGWSRVQLWNSALSLALQTIVAFLWVPSMGIIGAALANSAAVICVNLLQVYQVHRLLRFHPFSLALVKPFLASLAGYAVVLLIGSGGQMPALLRVGLAAVGLSLTYVAVLISLGFDKHSRIAWEQVRDAVLPRLLNPMAAILGK